MIPVVMLGAASTRYTKPVGYDDDQPRMHPPLGHYGPRNEGLPDVSTGWHIFADGNQWCAVGPTYTDLQQSIAGFGYTQREAYAHLMLAIKEGEPWMFDLLSKPELADFKIHQPTVAPDAR